MRKYPTIKDVAAKAGDMSNATRSNFQKVMGSSGSAGDPRRPVPSGPPYRLKS
jgi:hypothetical protein